MIATTPHLSTADPTPESDDAVYRDSVAHRAGFGLVVAIPIAVMFLPPLIGGVAAKNLGFQVLAYAALALALVGRSRTRALPITPTTVGLLFLLGAGVISTVAAGNTGVSTRALGFLGAIVAAHVAALVTIRTERRFAILVASSALAAVALSAVGIAELFRFKDAIADGLANEGNRSAFLATPFFEHSYLAAQAILPATLIAAGYLLGGRWLAKLSAAICLALPIAFLGVVFSRGAWAAFAGAFAVVLIGSLVRGARSARATGRGGHSSPLRWLLPCGIAILGLLAVVLLAASEGSLGPTARAAIDRLQSLLDPDLRLFNFSRVLVWQDALRIAGDSAPIGVGPGGFAQAFGEIHTGPRPLSHAHNQLLHTFAELGVLGIIGLALALIHPWIGAQQELGRDDQNAKPRVALAVMGAISGIVFLCGFESPLLFPAVAAQLGIFSGAASRLAGGPAPVKSGGVLGSSAAIGSRLDRARWTGLAVMAALLIFVCPSIWQHARASQLGARAAALIDSDPQEATALARRALERCPDHGEVLAILGNARFAVGDYVGAEEAFGKHLQATPGLSEALRFRAISLGELRRFDEAIELLRIAANRAADETAPEIRLILGNALFRTRRYEEARLLFTELVRENVHGKHPVLYRRLAVTLMNLGRNRALATQLLRRYAAVVQEGEARYARDLLTDMDRYYRP